MVEQRGDQDENVPVLDVIDSIYAVAIDPDRYETLIETWLKRLEATWRAGDPLPEPLVDHIYKAMEVYAHASDKSGADNVESLVARMQGGAVLAVDDTVSIAVVNPDAKRSYHIAPGAPLDALPFEGESLRVLEKTIAATFAQSSDHILRLMRKDNQRTVLLSLGLIRQSDDKEFVLLRTSDVAWPRALNAILEQTFDLTPAEVMVVRLLSEGASLPEISDARGASVATVRAQLRNIYEKTETHSQVEVVRMVLGLVVNGFGSSEEGRHVPRGQDRPLTQEPSYPRAHQRHVLRLHDQRRLGYTRFGAEDGRVVLMLHDPYFGDVWPASMVENAKERGLTILIPARPFYGETDPFPPKANNFEQFASDVEQLLDQLKINDVVLLTRAWGANFMLSVFDRVPDRIRGVVGVSAGAPMKSSEDLEKTPGFYRFFVKLRFLANPLFLDFITRLHVGQIKRKGVDWYRDQYVEGSPGDKKLMESPELQEVFERGLAFGSGHGHRAAFNDLSQEPADAWRRCMAITVPSISFYGSEDPLPRLELSKALADAHPNFERRVIEGVGQLLFFSHPDLVLQSIEDLFNRNR